MTFLFLRYKKFAFVTILYNQNVMIIGFKMLNLSLKLFESTYLYFPNNVFTVALILVFKF